MVEHLIAKSLNYLLEEKKKQSRKNPHVHPIAFVAFFCLCSFVRAGVSALPMSGLDNSLFGWEWGCLVLCGRFNSIPGLYPLDARSAPPATAKCPLGALSPLVKNH